MNNPTITGTVAVPLKGLVLLLLAGTWTGVGDCHGEPTTFQTPDYISRDATIRKDQAGLDLSDVGHLTYSPRTVFVAGTTRGPKSLIKVWACQDKELVHTFQVSGKAHAVTFSPDNATLVTGDATGNLGWETTIRAWNLTGGREQKIGTCVGEIADVCFSPDGTQLATVAKLGYFDSIATAEESEGIHVGQIKVWRFDGKGKGLHINIPQVAAGEIVLATRRNFAGFQ